VITLYTFGPFFGLPDGSPFVLKAMFLLKFAGLPYREDRGGYRKAPKGKLPYIDDDGIVVADSAFIRRHIETKYGFDYDAGLTAEQKATAWAVEKMCDDHLYWAVIDARWMEPGNFANGPARFFDGLPRPVRPVLGAMVRRKMAKTLQLHGLGRHTRAEIADLGCRDIAALADLLGDKPFLMGDKPCGADATVGAFVAGLFPPMFETPLRTAVESHANLVAYNARLMQLYFPGHAAA
jgi:glutathione S-transferase